MSSASELRAIALAEFATAGYLGTSLQRIADLAGLAKSSVLYHYASKETLLEAAVSPAIESMEGILVSFAGGPLTPARRRAFIEEFVDFLLQYRLEVHLFINQGLSIADVPVMGRANELVVRLAGFFSAASSSVEDIMRFGVALGGAAYTLVTRESLGLDDEDEAQTRAALIAIIAELLAPIEPRSAAGTDSAAGARLAAGRRSATNPRPTTDPCLASE